MEQEIAALVESIKRSSLYWAPEVRVQKLLPYLEVHGQALFDALKALPDDERELTGIDHVTRKVQ